MFTMAMSPERGPEYSWIYKCWTHRPVVQSCSIVVHCSGSSPRPLTVLTENKAIAEEVVFEAGSRKCNKACALKASSPARRLGWAFPDYNL